MKKVYYSNELTHWGIKGQKWGVRRYQDKDGKLTEEGKVRYNEQLAKVKEIGDVQAKLEALKRKITKDWDGKSKILVPKEVRSEYTKLYNEWNKAINKHSKEDIYIDIKTMDDGADYVVTQLYDKDLGGVVEYYSLIKHSDNNYNELYHYGVKGQKWGVRKDSESSQGISETDNSEYEEKRQKRERNKKIFIGVTLTAAGIAAISTLVKRFKNKSASQTISENKAAIAVGKEYVTNYNNVPIKNLESSRRLGIKNYMGKNHSYNIYFR